MSSRPLPIIAIEPGSAAARAGLRAGERIHRLNGARLRDLIDLRFEAAEAELEFEVENGDGRRRTLQIVRQPGEALGIVTEEMKARTCANKCVFCFVDQLPRHSRPGLGVRDEDYRYSFLHGNYVTLTNFRSQDLERVIEQGLSPLYVSVHATDPEVRARLLGLADPARAAILPRLDSLLAGGIRVHAQVVLCPGWNDGKVLDQTIAALAARTPGVDSIAVVPLGLTGHRADLTALEPVTAAMAGAVVAQCQAWQERLTAGCGQPLVYLADEWYCLSGTAVPPSAHYGDFPQLEDGVGMVRYLIDHLCQVGDSLPILERLRGRRVAVVTGVMAAPIIAEHLIDGLLARHARDVELVVVDNRHLGPGITVSGLLGGADIQRALAARGDLDLVLLPPNCLNGRRLFVDDRSLADLVAELGVEIELGLGDEIFNTNPVWEKE